MSFQSRWGANDLGANCGCGACGSTMDGLINPDAQSGPIPAFITKLRAQSGAKVLWMGYYAGNGQGSFKGYRGDLVRTETEIARFAELEPGFYFSDA